MSKRFIQNPWLSDVFTTTNATPSNGNGTTNYTAPSGVAGYVQVTVVARNTATGVGATIVTGAEFHNIAGVLTVTQLVTPIVSLIGSIAIAVTIAASGTSVQTSVTGVAATNIEWLVDSLYRVN
jgi:hypothetical protein